MRGEQLAEQLGVCVRTVYRDIAALQQQGAHIDGAPGVGYQLQPGHALPPLMFTLPELEALALGLRWVRLRAADPELAPAARGALNKVRAVLPAAARFELDHMPLLVGPSSEAGQDAARLPQLRAAIRAQHKLRLSYRDAAAQTSERVVWPFALGFFEQSRILSCWCELRQGFRHFRLDRMAAVQALGERYPRPRQQLMLEWRASENLPPLDDC